MARNLRIVTQRSDILAQTTVQLARSGRHFGSNPYIVAGQARISFSPQYQSIDTTESESLGVRRITVNNCIAELPAPAAPPRIRSFSQITGEQLRVATPRRGLTRNGRGRDSLILLPDHKWGTFCGAGPSENSINILLLNTYRISMVVRVADFIGLAGLCQHTGQMQCQTVRQRAGRPWRQAGGLAFRLPSRQSQRRR